MNLMHHLGIAVVLAVGGWHAATDGADVGTVVAFIFGLAKVNDPWHDIINWFRDATTNSVKYRLVADAGRASRLMSDPEITGLPPAEATRENAAPKGEHGDRSLARVDLTGVTSGDVLSCAGQKRRQILHSAKRGYGNQNSVVSDSPCVARPFDRFNQRGLTGAFYALVHAPLEADG